MSIKYKKQGTILIAILLLIILIIFIWLLVIIVQWFQINNILSDIKVNLFFIVQNTIMAYDGQLKYDTYIADEEKMSQIIYDLLYQNHIKYNKNIKSIQLEEVLLCKDKFSCQDHINSNLKNAFVHVKLKINFLPIIKLENTVLSYTIHQDVKLSLMEY